MKRVVLYKSIDPYYSDVEQTYIGLNADEIDRQQFETEEFMRRGYPYLGMVYNTKILLDETNEI